MGDDYFNTTYYSVDRNMHKSLIPTEKIQLLLNTVELAFIFSDTIHMPRVVDTVDYGEYRELNKTLSETSEYILSADGGICIDTNEITCGRDGVIDRIEIMPV